ncbi:MAG: ribonuclease HII [Candidatus Pacebacteria bacterium]|nr:ribonuclease HII [Candidatus Paceibacterota bacterium]
MLWTIGVDEAGRGPLAGPVAVGVFAVPLNFDRTYLTGIRDSKKLSERQREEWYTHITASSLARWSVALVGSTHIDAHGIVDAIRTAMSRALAHLELDPSECVVLLDGGLSAPCAYLNQTTIIRGDASEPFISAAALLAKVTRDKYMRTQCLKYPEYGFSVHKGYGTAAHIHAVQAHGLCKLHRVSFCRRLLTS